MESVALLRPSDDSSCQPSSSVRILATHSLPRLATLLCYRWAPSPASSSSPPPSSRSSPRPSARRRSCRSTPTPSPRRAPQQASNPTERTTACSGSETDSAASSGSAEEASSSSAALARSVSHSSCLSPRPPELCSDLGLTLPPLPFNELIRIANPLLGFRLLEVFVDVLNEYLGEVGLFILHAASAVRARGPSLVELTISSSPSRSRRPCSRTTSMWYTRCVCFL